MYIVYIYIQVRFDELIPTFTLKILVFNLVFRSSLLHGCRRQQDPARNWNDLFCGVKLRSRVKYEQEMTTNTFTKLCRHNIRKQFTGRSRAYSSH